MTNKWELNRKIEELEQRLEAARSEVLHDIYFTNFDVRMWADQAEKVLNEETQKNDKNKS